MTEQKNDTTDDRNHRQHEWMIRPCNVYKEEYSDCKSIRARIHQYYIYGETLDCSQWKKDYTACCDFRTNDTEEAYKSLVQSESKRKLARLKSHYDNNVWERRKEPPDDWNRPLPDFLEKRYEYSNLRKYAELYEKQIAPNVKTEESMCTIL